MQMNEYEKCHNDFLRRQGAECAVLLKSNGDFPLDRPGKIALYGSGARNTVKGGTGSGEVNSRFFVTIEQGLKNAGFLVTTKEWLDAYDAVYARAHKDFIKEIKRRAKQNHTMAVMEGMGAVMPEPEYELPLDGDGTTAVYVLARISGEGSDRNPVAGDILLSASERRDILALREKYEKFLLVLNVGGVVDLSGIDAVENILLLSQLGTVTGDIFADILLGRSNPSGKLASTWAGWEDYPAIGEFGDIDETRYREGVYVGYRYFDTVGKKALFPFGFGLSYTQFEIAAEQVRADGEKVSVTAKVCNTGSRTGKEVVQLYVSSPSGRLDQPYQSLAAWKKTGELAPGASETVMLSFNLSEIASYDAENAQYILEKGDYVLRLGKSSADTEVAGTVCLDREAVVKKVRSCCGKPDFQDWKPQENKERFSAEGAETGGLKPQSGEAAKEKGTAPRIEISASSIRTQKAEYDKEQPVDPQAENLCDEQLAYLSVGAFSQKGGALSIIGNASGRVAGAAGETTGQLDEREFPVMVMADGPAGLRLSRKYLKDDKGIHPIGETMPATIADFLPKPLIWLMSLFAKKEKPGDKVYEQYATAIPIGTAIAQSWNLEFAQKCGDVVGDEMERFHVQLWLAPALNIHRSIRCGRNFEYFSEDPFISGKFAAALTKGVQKHPGCGTTIKHYAANNQETNRYNNNSQVSERAMREIYLKGFEICVREAQPCAVMTSYNLLNGRHTSERRDLIEDILRSEFGFEGIVMTDWIINGGTMNKASVHPAPQAAKIAAAGGDLTMPGGKNDFNGILEAVQKGELSRRQLQINATRIGRMAKRLADGGENDIG